MRIILDTNVFVSGVFFTGPPNQILRAWRDGRVALVVSPEILEEYQRVGEELAARFLEVDLQPFIDLLVIEGELFHPPPLPQTVCDDPDDDKFLACAIASQVKCVVSGDKHLLRTSGFQQIEVLKPRTFVERYLRL